MSEPLIPNPIVRRLIRESVAAESHMCWTCRSCVLECPVNIATSRLQPVKLVRLANLGLLDEMMALPETWYCLACNRCEFVCPMSVKPATLIAFARRRALETCRVSHEKFKRHRELMFNLQRRRWTVARDLMAAGRGEAAVAVPPSSLVIGAIPLRPTRVRNGGTPRRAGARPAPPPPVSPEKAAESPACFTCQECSGACPAYGGRDVFDPMTLIRMANLGMVEQLIRSPAIWLCLACERCSGNCSQKVKAHVLIREIQEMAIRRGVVDRGFRLRLQDAMKPLYAELLGTIDGVFGF